MTFQLTVYSLLFLVLLLVDALDRMEAFPRNRRGAAPAGSDADRLNRMIRDASRVYLVFAPWALLLYLSGKPDLHTQYLAWAVIVIEVLRGMASLLDKLPWVRFLGVLSVGILIYLWAAQLPVFQAAPR